MGYKTGLIKCIFCLILILHMGVGHPYPKGSEMGVGPFFGRKENEYR